MRLIEKSLTENIYNALNESSNQSKATKRVARYKKSNIARMNESKDINLNDVDLTTGFVNVDIGEGHNAIHFMYNKDTQEVIYTKGYAAGRVHKKTTYSELPHEEFPYTTEGIIKAYIDTKLNTINESDKYYVAFSSGELNMDVPFNNDKIKKEVIKGKGGKGPDGVETDLVKYIGTKEDLEKLMDKDFDGEYKNSIKKLDESEEAQLNSLYDEKKIEWTDLSGSDQTAVEYFSSNFGDNIEGKSWDEVESDIREACHEIGYANEELINNGYWNDGDMDPEPDEKKVTDYIFQNYFLSKKNSKNMNESAETGSGMSIKEYAMNYFDGDIDEDVTDTEIDMLVAFVNDFNEEPKDNYDRFLNLLGERTKVVKVGNNVLTCDFSSVFKPYEDKLKGFFDMDYSEFNEAWAEAVSNLEALVSGNAGEKTYGELIDILTSKQMNESVDNDPDLDADQVQADVDYWTDVDEANTEDVTDMRPIGVYTISNNSAIYVYQIEYDIEDRVLAGDSSDETKAKWRDIIYGDGEAYFWYGDIKVPFNDVVRTDM